MDSVLHPPSHRAAEIAKMAKEIAGIQLWHTIVETGTLVPRIVMNQLPADKQLNGDSARGKDEMCKLARRAFSALENADLIDLLEPLQRRVFDRPPADVLNVELVDGVWQWRFKPFAELLLLHIIDTSANATIPHTDQRRDIAWAVEMSGF